MKKVLFTTSALVACAGMAAADVTLSGAGRFGIVHTGSTDAGVRRDGLGTNAAAASSTRIEKRMTIAINGSGETDGGLSFGGNITLRSNEGSADFTVAPPTGVGSAVTNANVWMGNDTWRVTVGNTSGANLFRVGYYQGSIGLDGNRWNNVSFNMGTQNFQLNTYSSSAGTNAQDAVRLDFNVGDFGVSLSAVTGNANLSAATHKGIAVSYNFGDWNVAAGYETDVAVGANSTVAAGTLTDVASISAAGSIGDFGVGIQYTDRSQIGSKVVLNGSYSFGDTTVTAYVANTSEDALGTAGFTATSSDTEYGLGFTHSLGGAVLVGGVNRDFTKATQATLGVRFGF